MNRTRYLLTALGGCTAVLVIGPPAHAYVDPGSGSILLQLVLASLFGAAFGLRLFWGSVKGFFARLFGRGSGNRDDAR